MEIMLEIREKGKEKKYFEHYLWRYFMPFFSSSEREEWRVSVLLLSGDKNELFHVLVKSGFFVVCSDNSFLFVRKIAWGAVAIAVNGVTTKSY